MEKQNSGERLKLSPADIIKLLEEGSDKQFTEADLVTLAKSKEEEEALGSHIIDNLKNFESVGQIRVCELLIDNSFGFIVIKDLEKFSSEAVAKIPEIFVSEYRGGLLAEFLEKFPECNHVDIADKLIETGQGDQLLKHIDKFKDLDHSDIISRVLKTETLQRNISEHMMRRHPMGSRGIKKTSPGLPAAYSVFDNIKKLKGIDIDKLIKEVIATGSAGMFAIGHNINDIDSKKHNTIAHQIIDAGGHRELGTNLERFKDLDQGVASELVQSGEILEAAHHIDGFLDLGERMRGLLSDTTFIKTYQKELTSIIKRYPEITIEKIQSNLSGLIVESWEEDKVLSPEDQAVFKSLGSIFDKDLLVNLFTKQGREAMHIVGPSIEKLYKQSGLSTKAFQSDFLRRIDSDNSFYNDDNNQSAIYYFNTIVEGVDLDAHKTIEIGLKNSYTKELSEYLLRQGVYKSWDWLKKYYELSNLLNKKEIFDKLEEMKGQGKTRHVEFFTKLALHPTSKVSMEKVFQFMTNPSEFLEVGDIHTGTEIQDRKKPSNYTSFPHLDLSAEQLRDALIEGTLDDLQFFVPHSKEYSIPTEEITGEKLINLLSAGLGSYKEKIKGNAKNPGKLFQKVKQICAEFNMDYHDLLSNASNLSPDRMAVIEKVLFDKDFGIKDSRDKNEYILNIYPKSSPEGHLAGNDTVCCMPFGSGKNNVYMYNTSCAVFAVQRKTAGQYRTIAQSVMTPDIDIGMPIAELRTAVEKEEVMSRVIEEDLTRKKSIMVTADNIEVAPNAEKFKNDIEFLYGDFFKEYTTILKESHPNQNFAEEVLLIGKGHTDLQFKNTREMRNLFVPIQPLAYSDNYGPKIDFLMLKNLSDRSDVVSKSLSPEGVRKDSVSVGSIKPLSAEDTLRVAYMEGKVYAENESLVQYLHRIGNELTAKDINNKMKQRPNLSLKIEDQEGNLDGYLIAYQGVIDKKSSNPEEAIYISDLAVDTQKSKLAGGRLINKFTEIISTEYLSKGILMPVIAEARESTSYKIINKHLDAIASRLGYAYQMVEMGTEKRGDDVMHKIKLIPSKKLDA